MLRTADLDPYIDETFSGRLESLGFIQVARRKWVRSTKVPIRELFALGSLKGGLYSPTWGFSSGAVPSISGKRFKRQTTDKNAVMDLAVDPLDLASGRLKHTFSFVSGWDKEVPVKQIQRCAKHFVPLALADFDRVETMEGFCRFFRTRERLRYVRFPFDAYVQHQLTAGFVSILEGNRDDGIAQLQAFCETMELPFDDPILTEYIAAAG